MPEQRKKSRGLDLGPGITLRGLTKVAVGPASPVRILRDEHHRIETVEYVVLMEVEVPTDRDGRPVRLVFTALFDEDPENGARKSLLNRSSVN